MARRAGDRAPFFFADSRGQGRSVWETSEYRYPTRVFGCPGFPIRVLTPINARRIIEVQDSARRLRKVG